VKLPYPAMYLAIDAAPAGVNAGWAEGFPIPTCLCDLRRNGHVGKRPGSRDITVGIESFTGSRQ
jgi:hypothetical protein